MNHSSLNLTARDFDAYRAEKATSNAYSRPRIEVKQRALAWARGVAERLAALGIAVDMHGSDEHPTLRNKRRVDCQWVFFWRDQSAREELDRLLEQGRSISDAIDDPSPFTRHAFLALRVDAEHVEVCFAVHPDAKVDVDNLRARLATAGERAPSPLPEEERGASGPGEGTLAAELTSALRALPEEFLIGVSPDDRIACSTATAEAIMGMLERAAGGQTPLWIGWSVPRDMALDHSALLDEQLEDAIVALAPIYRLVAWSRENDHIALDSRIEGLEQAKARTHAEVEAQNERWRAEQAAQRERSLKEAQARIDEAARRPAPTFRGPPTAQARKPSLDALFSKPQRGPAGGKHDGHGKQDGRHDGHGKQDGRHDGHGKQDGRHDGHGRHDAHGGRHDAHGAKHDVHGRHDARDAGPRLETKPSAASEPSTAEPREAHGDEHAPGSTTIEKGTRVRVLTGPFADKIGVVSELDGRGGARVLLGLLSTRLDVTALEPAAEERERPALSSSHRRPAAPAPRKTR